MFRCCMVCKPGAPPNGMPKAPQPDPLPTLEQHQHDPRSQRVVVSAPSLPFGSLLVFDGGFLGRTFSWLVFVNP